MLKSVCLIVVLVAGCMAFEFPKCARPHGISLENERIFGGQDAEVGQFPYQASLRACNGTKHFCGGSIIGKRFILTSAHCTGGIFSNPQKVEVVVGGNRVSTGGTYYQIDKIINHPKYNQKRNINAISVIRTTKPIELSDSVALAALPTSDVPAEGNVAATMSGYGQFNVRTPEKPGKYAIYLQWKDTVTLSRDECIRQLGSPGEQFVHPNTLCTTNPMGVGGCKGDHGGPLVSRTTPRVLIGVLSWVFECGGGRPDLFERVYPHLAFIRDAMKN